jgi:hypothetical protein
MDISEVELESWCKKHAELLQYLENDKDIDIAKQDDFNEWILRNHFDYSDSMNCMQNERVRLKWSYMKNKFTHNVFENKGKLNELSLRTNIETINSTTNADAAIDNINTVACLAAKARLDADIAIEAAKVAMIAAKEANDAIRTASIAAVEAIILDKKMKKRQSNIALAISMYNYDYGIGTRIKSKSKSKSKSIFTWKNRNMEVEMNVFGLIPERCSIIERDEKRQRIDT